MVCVCVTEANKHPIRKIDRIMVNGVMRTREGLKEVGGSN